MEKMENKEHFPLFHSASLYSDDPCDPVFNSVDLGFPGLPTTKPEERHYNENGLKA
jgi:hypothetical protein